MAKENDHQKRRGVKSNAKGWDDGEKRGQDEGTTRTPIRGSFRGRVNRMRVSLLHHLRSRISIRAWERRRERQRLCNGGRCRHGTPNSFNFSAITFGITMLAAVILNLVLRVPRVLGDGASMLLGARGGVDLEGRESPATLGSDIGIFLDNDLEGMIHSNRGECRWR